MFCFIHYHNCVQKCNIKHAELIMEVQGAKRRGGGRFRFRFRFRPIRIHLLPESPVAVNRPPYSKQSPTLNMENLLWNKVSGLKKLPNEKKRESWELIDQSELIVNSPQLWMDYLNTQYTCTQILSIRNSAYSTFLLKINCCFLHIIIPVYCLSHTFVFNNCCDLIITCNLLK